MIAFTKISVPVLPILSILCVQPVSFIPSLILKRNSNALFLLQRVRDEAHRFAITHHRRLRSKQTLYSALDRIPGIGAARKRALLRAFGSVKRIEAASLDELLKVPRMSEQVAREILHALQDTPH